MTRQNRHVRVRIGKHGTDSLGSTGTDYEFSTTNTGTRLRSIDSWGGQKVRPIEGRTESETWTVGLLESSTGLEITSKLATTEGRPDLLRRLIDLSVRPTADGAWSSTHVQATGRLKDVVLSESIGGYDFIALDERLIEREMDVFVGVGTTAGPTSTTGCDILHGTTTTQLYPPGRTVAWDEFDPAGTATWTVEIASSDPQGVVVVPESTANKPILGDREPVFPEAIRAMEDDLKPGDLDLVGESFEMVPDGQFRNLVAEIDGTKREIGRLAQGGQIGEQLVGPSSVYPTGTRLLGGMAVLWPSSSQPAVGSNVELRLMMPQRAPSEVVPKHLGSTGTHPVQLARDMLEAADVRIDSTQFDALVADKSFPEVTFRVTGSDKLGPWLEDHIWQPFGLVPTVNRHGRLSPRIATLPSATGADAVPDVTQLTKITASEVREDPPTWEHLSNEQVTRIEYTWESYRDYTNIDDRTDLQGNQFPSDLSADDLDDREVDTDPKLHDRVSEFGQRSEKVTLDGLHDIGAVEAASESFAREVFARYGDGPVRTRVRGMSALEGTETGEFVVIDQVPVYPNLRDGERGGTRIVGRTT